MLTSNVKLLVPGTRDKSILYDTEPYVKDTVTHFSQWFGGATIYESSGYYLLKDGTLVSEPVHIVESFCSTKQLEAHIAGVVCLAKSLCKELEQESIAMIVNNVMYYISNE